MLGPITFTIPDKVAAVRQLRIPSHIAGVLAVLALTVVGTQQLWRGGTMVGNDTITFFHPMYSALAERLRAGDIPGWNPHQFGGAPFAAAPESGWMYLPAMLLFAALPLAAAVNTYIFLHFAIAGLATYALARTLGMSLVGALVASVAYEFSGFFFAFSLMIPAFIQVATWVPLMLLGAELALRSGNGWTRMCWWGASAFALSQILAAWIGQGSYYACLVLGSYLAYRTLLDSPTEMGGAWDRLRRLAVHGTNILLFSCGLAAAGILPRLEFYAVSNLANGYEGSAAEVGLFTWRSLPSVVIGRIGNQFYAGAVVVALALYAVRVVKGRFAAPYFLAFSGVTLVLATQHTTPLHAVFYSVLPRFEDLHRHFPDRIITVFYLASALLAGAAVSSLRNKRPVVQVVLLLAVFLDLLSASGNVLAVSGYQVDVEAYFDPSSAASFLQSQQESHSDQPFRFFGYDPRHHMMEQGEIVYYRENWPDPATRELVVNNLATKLGLQDIQGYNPIQIDRFVEYMAALNGRAQEYHGSYVLSEGLGSPLLDVLGVRYVVVPMETPTDRPDLLWLTQHYPTVYQDDRVKVLENPGALPRAWIVHEARQIEAEEALPLLASRTVDPRQTALLEDAPPMVAQPNDPAADRASIFASDPDHVRIRTTTDAPGLLILSEIMYPAWKAYVDGKSVSIQTANHALRAVPIPAGTHLVEMRFESRALQVGTGLSLASHLALAGIIVVALWRHWRSSRNSTPSITVSRSTV